MPPRTFRLGLAAFAAPLGAAAAIATAWAVHAQRASGERAPADGVVLLWVLLLPVFVMHWVTVGWLMRRPSGMPARRFVGAEALCALLTLGALYALTQLAEGFLAIWVFLAPVAITWGLFRLLGELGGGHVGADSAPRAG